MPLTYSTSSTSSSTNSSMMFMLRDDYTRTLGRGKMPGFGISGDFFAHSRFLALYNKSICSPFPVPLLLDSLGRNGVTGL